MNESTVPPQIHAWALPVILSQCFGTSVETRRTFHRRFAACIETTRLSCKDCLAGYRYKKTAVINNTTHSIVGSRCDLRRMDCYT